MIPYEERFRLNQVEGLITQAEGEYLAEMALRCPSWASIVEIGSHTGRSTLYLAEGAKLGGGHVTAVDPFPDPGYSLAEDADDDPFGLETGEAVFRRFCDNLTAADAWPQVTLLRAPSLRAAAFWANPIGLLFLDASHSYNDVRDDAEAWLPFVVAGGFAAFHDWCMDESFSEESPVAEAVQDEIGGDPRWSKGGQVDNLAVWVKS